jgi:hypothetical protein
MFCVFGKAKTPFSILLFILPVFIVLLLVDGRILILTQLQFICYLYKGFLFSDNNTSLIEICMESFYWDGVSGSG